MASQPLSRRHLLGGSAAVAAGLVGVGLTSAGAHAAEGGHADVPVFTSGGRVYVGAPPNAPLSPTEKAFSDIDGTPTMYIRDGSGVRKPATFRCTFAFYDALVAWVRRLRSLSAEAGYSGLSFITSAGAYVNKPGQHGAGTAIDIDEIGWSDGKICRPIGLDWNSSNGALRKRYYALDATLRAHFRWSLDRTYNAAHHDHIHSDFGGLPVVLGTGSSSDVGWVQASLNELMGAGLAVDKIWGPLTQGAFDTSRQRLGVTSGNPHTTTSVYRAWLDAVARKGFANQTI
ncbi:MAG TPA: extensin family protein [Actinopolymorphaceae bacterium]